MLSMSSFPPIDICFMKKDNIGKLKDCYGCGVCSASCPKKVITMKESSGFYFPQVDQDNCVECGICLSVCSFNHKEVCRIQDKVTRLEKGALDKGLNTENMMAENGNIPGSCYAAYLKDEKMRYAATSGGVAYALAKQAVAKGVTYCGVKYCISEERAVHYFATTEEELLPSLSSKYIQSYTADAFSAFQADRKYMVVGTPCQIDSLRRLTRKRRIEDNFVFIDFFCHGVPSLLMWRKYLAWARKTTGKESKVLFRSKVGGWHESTTVEINGEKGHLVSPLTKGDMFFAFFLGDRCLNKACYDSCKYKWAASAADIRVGDFWGKKYRKDDKGVSSVVCFSQKGEQMMKELENSGVCHICPENWEDASDFQKKENARRSPSCKIVRKLLATDRSIESIHRTARLLETPARIARYTRYYLKHYFRRSSETS